jgi:tetratricopeptide (TPR) repeat protein
MKALARALWLGFLVATAQGAEELPGVDALVHPSVAALPDPVAIDFHGGVRMAVTAATDEAQAHVIQGFNHLHGGWEFEAYRHFCAALRSDPECLLAHWGVAVSLLSPQPDTAAQRGAAIQRMLALVDLKKGTDLELGYVYGLIRYLQDGPVAAADAFRKLSGRFPNDPQAVIFCAMFGRTGYDESGDAMPEQAHAEKMLRDLLDKHPENPFVIHSLLIARAEAPDLGGDLELARKLCRLAPEYPPYFHLLGHYEFRCGEFARAASAFARASLYYDQWMKASGVSVADCPEWVKSECYRSVALAASGDFETAYAAAASLAQVPMDGKRLSAAGSRMLLWEARTMPARLLMKQRGPGYAERALKSLPNPKDEKAYMNSTLAYWYADGLRICLEGHRLIGIGKPYDAKQVAAALATHGAAMAERQGAAEANGEKSAWNGAFRAMEVLTNELQGDLAMAGPPEGRGSAFNWYRSAADHQKLPGMLMPPAVLTPMPVRLGSYYLAVGKPDKAAEAYQEALRMMPRDAEATAGLAKAREKAK